MACSRKSPLLASWSPASRPLVSCLAVTAQLFTIQQALATSFSERPFPEAVQNAEIIARGKTGMNYTDWSVSRDGSKKIFTFTELIIDEVIKGRIDGPTAMVRELGGAKDGVGLQVTGAATFKRNEDVVLLLGKENQDGSYDLKSMMMGKINIVYENGQETLRGPALMGPLKRQYSRYFFQRHDDTSYRVEPEKKYTLTDLRELVKTQEANKNTMVSTGNSLDTFNKGEASIPAPAAASQLQSSQPGGAVSPRKGDSSKEETSHEDARPKEGRLLWILIGGVVLSVGAVLMIFRKVS